MPVGGVVVMRSSRAGRAGGGSHGGSTAIALVEACEMGSIRAARKLRSFPRWRRESGDQLAQLSFDLARGRDRVRDLFSQ